MVRNDDVFFPPHTGGSQRNTPSPKEKSPPSSTTPRVTSPPALVAPTSYQPPKLLVPSPVDPQGPLQTPDVSAVKSINGEIDTGDKNYAFHPLFIYNPSYLLNQSENIINK